MNFFRCNLSEQLSLISEKNRRATFLKDHRSIAFSVAMFRIDDEFGGVGSGQQTVDILLE